jgi:hypothetical protein
MTTKRAAVLGVLTALALVGILAWSGANATTAWTLPANAREVSIATTTTGTEAASVITRAFTDSPVPACDAGQTCTRRDAGSYSPWPGLNLASVRGFNLCVETVTDAGPFLAGTLQAYVLNPVSGNWARNPSLDVTLTAGLYRQCFAGWQVPSPIGRIAFLPSGTGQPSSIYLIGTPN